MALWGDYVGVNSYHQSIPFFDGREQLKQNLTFLLRAADKIRPFRLILQRPGFTDGTYYDAYSTGYAFASFYNITFAFEEYPSTTYWNEFRPFIDNYNHRNFVLDPNHLTSDGETTTGAGIDLDRNYLTTACRLPICLSYKPGHHLGVAFQFSYYQPVSSLSAGRYWCQPCLHQLCDGHRCNKYLWSELLVGTRTARRDFHRRLSRRHHSISRKLFISGRGPTGHSCPELLFWT